MTELREISFHPPSEEVRTLLSQNVEKKQLIEFLLTGLIVLGVIAIYTTYHHNILKVELLKTKLNV